MRHIFFLFFFSFFGLFLVFWGFFGGGEVRFFFFSLTHQHKHLTRHEMLSTATTNPSSNATPTAWPLRMQKTWTSTKAAAPSPVKHASIREVPGVVRKKAVDALASNFAIALAEARQEENPESDADIAGSLTASVTYDDNEYCFNTDGLLLDPRYDKGGRLDRVAVHHETRTGDWLLLDVVQVCTLATAAEPAAKKRKIVTIDIGKGGKEMYEVFA